MHINVMMYSNFFITRLSQKLKYFKYQQNQHRFLKSFTAMLKLNMKRENQYTVYIGQEI